MVYVYLCRLMKVRLINSDRVTTKVDLLYEKDSHRFLRHIKNAHRSSCYHVNESVVRQEYDNCY